MPEPSRGLVSALAVLVLLAATAGSMVVAEVRRGIESGFAEVGPAMYELGPDGTGASAPSELAWTVEPAANLTGEAPPVDQTAPAAPMPDGNGTASAATTSTAPAPKPTPRPSPSPAPQPRHRTRSS